MNHRSLTMSQTAVNCKLCSAPAEEVYTRAGLTMRLCRRCITRQHLQDAFEARLLEIDTCMREKQHDEALRILDEIWDTNRTHDTDGWLERSVLSHRALVLFDQGKLPEALDVYRTRGMRGFPESSDFPTHQLGLAEVLAGLGHYREAIDALEDGLRALDRRTLPGALSLLASLVRVSQAAGQALSPHWKPLIEACAARWGIELPAQMTAVEEFPIDDAISWLESAVLHRQTREV